jgi:hypothetical protein
MTPFRLSSLLLLPLLAGVTLVSTDTEAQIRKVTVNPVAPRGVQQAPVPLTQNVANVLTDRMSGTASVASNGALDGVPMLNGFHFRFSNGDHELRKLTALVASPSSATISFVDKNADDPYKAAVTWINVKGGGARGEVHAAGMAQFDVPLPMQRPANTRLVLTGFELRDKDDEHVQMIGIWLDEARNVARVSLLSFATLDWVQGAGARLGTAGRPTPPIGQSWAKVYPSAAAADQWVNAHQKYSHRAFAVHLQYAFVPTSIVEGEDYFTGSTRAPSSGKEFQPRSAIQGFEFYFDNKGQHIREIGVMPRLPGSAVTSRAPAGEFIEFQDKDRNDPIKWAVKLLTIKP